MDKIFCTLFDTNYLDKGLTLYRSMEERCGEFRLYIFAFDDTCAQILKKEELRHAVIISLGEFETLELLKVKEERTRAEYCWTCTPWVIKHVLEKFNEPICTYIDTDMQFFSDPQPVFDDMRSRGSSVIIVPHRFRDAEAEKKAHDEVGSYCVEFNTFVNDDEGRRVLNWWADRCLEWCFYAVPGTTQWYGDQKYLNEFEKLTSKLMVCGHFGLGLAPWNIGLVDFAEDRGGVPFIRVKASGEIVPVVLYHFENVVYLTEHILHASSRTSSKDLHKAIYDPYIGRLIEARRYVESKYDIRLSKAKRVVTKNPLMGLYQRYISPFRRVKHLHDLYWVK